MKDSNNSKKTQLWITCMFMCIVICFDIVSLVIPDKQFSETENRMLAGLPEITAEGLYDGSLGEDTEKYMSDQFAYRDTWASISFFVRNTIFNQSEMNGVYIGSDGYLMLIPSEYDQDALSRKIDAINTVAKNYINVNQCISVIPNAAAIMRNKMPEYAKKSGQIQKIKEICDSLHGIKTCNVSSTFKLHRNEELYYHTDHHWTTYGAYLAFCEIAPTLDIDPSGFRYNVHRVSESFEGTLASKSGCHKYKDIIEIYVPKNETPVSVTYSDRDEVKGTIYETEPLGTKDQYAVFLGGNHPVVTIRTTAETDRTLLLIKDSYANCFVQFLIPYFDQIIIVDPRYCFDTVDMFISQNDVTDILYLYNADTFMTDTSLTDFLSFSVE